MWPPEALEPWVAGPADWASQPGWSELGQASEPPDVSRCKSKMAASEKETQMWKAFMWFSFGIIEFSSFLKAYRGPWDTKNQEITFSRVRVTWEVRFVRISSQADLALFQLVISWEKKEHKTSKYQPKGINWGIKQLALELQYTYWSYIYKEKSQIFS